MKNFIYRIILSSFLFIIPICYINGQQDTCNIVALKIEQTFVNEGAAPNFPDPVQVVLTRFVGDSICTLTDFSYINTLNDPTFTNITRVEPDENYMLFLGSKHPESEFGCPYYDYVVIKNGCFIEPTFVREFSLPSDSLPCSYWFNINIESFDLVKIEDIKYSGTYQTDTNSSNICVADDEGLFNLTLSVENPNGPKSITIQAISKEGDLLGEVWLGAYSAHKSFSFKDLVDNYYNQEVYFRLAIDYGLDNRDLIYSGKKGPYVFFRQISGLQNMSVHSTACSKDTFTIELEEGQKSYLDDFYFAIRNANLPEDYTNIDTLKLVDTTQPNKILLTQPETEAFDVGKYKLHVINLKDSGCAVTKTVHIGPRPKPIKIKSLTPDIKGIFMEDTFHISKNGGADGKITIETDNHDRFKSIILAGKEYLGNSVSNLKGEDIPYTIQAKDKDGCLSSATEFKLKQPDTLKIEQITTDSVDCAKENFGENRNGGIQVIASGGIGPYSMHVPHSATSYSGVRRICSISNLSAGEYSITIKDTIGTTLNSTASVAVRVPDINLDTALVSDLLCYENNQGKISLKISPNDISKYSFSLRNHEGNIVDNRFLDNLTYSQLPAGTYTAYAINRVYGCKDSISNIDIQSPDKLKINLKTNKIARYGDSTGVIRLHLEGGTSPYQYKLFSNNLDISDFNKHDTSHYNTAILNDGQFSDTTIIRNLPESYYYIKTIDDNHCRLDTLGIYLEQPDTALSVSVTTKKVDCFGTNTGVIYPKAKGGWKPYKFEINNVIYGNLDSINNLYATKDSLFVIDSAGIRNSISFEIKQNAKLLGTIDSIYKLKCHNDTSGAFKLNIEGGTPTYRLSLDSINWLSGDSMSNLSSMTDHIVHILDINNCYSSQTITIVEPKPIEVVKDTIINSFCKKSNGMIKIIAEGGTPAYKYKWYSGDTIDAITGSLDNIPAGRYELIITDKNSCQHVSYYNVSNQDGPKINSIKADSITCFGDSDGRLIIEKVSGGAPAYKYYLNDKEGDSIFNNLQGIEYSIKVEDTKGCIDIKDYQIPYPEKMILTANIIPPTCYNSEDGRISMKVKGGNHLYTYLWSDSTTNKDLINKNKGKYSIRVTDQKGCNQKKDYIIQPPKAPYSNLKRYPNVLCEGNEMKLDGGDFTYYKWFNKKRTLSNNRFLIVSTSDTYFLEVADKKGCSVVDTFSLKVSKTPLDALFLMQDSALINEVIEAIDVTYPVPDSVNWFFSPSVDILESNKWKQQFSSPNAKIVDVELNAWYGGCVSYNSKKVYIYDMQNNRSKEKMAYQPLILDCVISPNPNNGEFKLNIELSKAEEVIALVYDIKNGNVLDKRKIAKSLTHEVFYNLKDLKTGLYIIAIRAGNEIKQLKVIIQ